MSTVQEIEMALAKLPPKDVQAVANWLAAQTSLLDSEDRLSNLRKARGIWKNRDDVPDIQSLRTEWNRH
jgi:hypothetical protein